METEVLDYLVQLKGVIIDFDSGKLESFTISKDYFSDRFSYAYNPRDKSLEITDENAVGGPQKIRVRYHDFRTSFLAFYKTAMLEFELLYPELKSNNSFRDIANY